MTALRNAIIIIAVVVIGVILWQFIQAAMALYYLLPTLTNAAAWVILSVGKYFIYLCVATSVAWLLLALCNNTKKDN